MQSQQQIGGNYMLSKAGLTGLSGAATTFTTAFALTYALAGKALSKAAVAGGATPTVDFVTGLPIIVQPGKATVVLWCLDAAGAVRLVQGSVEPLDLQGNLINSAPNFPGLPDTLVAFAYSVHKIGAAAAAFTVGTSLWNAANTVHTLADLIALPNRPQAA